MPTYIFSSKEHKTLGDIARLFDTICPSGEECFFKDCETNNLLIIKRKFTYKRNSGSCKVINTRYIHISHVSSFDNNGDVIVTWREQKNGTFIEEYYPHIRNRNDSKIYLDK